MSSLSAAAVVPSPLHGSAPETRRVTGLRVIHASTVEEFRLAGQLVAEYIAWCRARYREKAGLVDRYFDAAAALTELADVNIAYAGRDGAFLLATIHGQPAGCVAMQKQADGLVELKRLYTRPEFRGFGLGRHLAAVLIALARRRGFARMRLETGDRLVEAHALYRSLGFRPTAAARVVIGPDAAHQDHLLTMELDLQR